MFYEEKLIDGVWHCRSHPEEEFRPLTTAQLNDRLSQERAARERAEQDAAHVRQANENYRKENEIAVAAREKTEEDARRYRWLRDAPNDYPTPFIAIRCPINVVSQARGETADFAVDQALKERHD